MRLYFIALLCGICLLTPLAACGSGTLTGASNAMNPAFSVNGLFVAETSNDRDDAEVNAVRLQEAEMHLTAVVDPFWIANVIFAVLPTADDAAAFEIAVEEANIEATSLPWGVGLKLGKFFLPFGKHTPLHTHQFPFVESPLGVASFLGAGLTESGAELAYSLPLPWYNDLIVYAMNGDTEIWDQDDRAPIFGVRLSNVLDVSDDATLEMGGSFITGPGSVPRIGFAGDYRVTGADLTYKWISSSRSHGPALNLTAEVLWPDPEGYSGAPMGWYVISQYRFNHNWWLGLTHGRVDTDETGVQTAFAGIGETWESKLNFTYAPSEFSAMRVEISKYDDRLGDADDLRFSVQWNFTIGSHPAHTY